VPSVPKTSADRAVAAGILLIEEYHPLAVAICSALKRFAPNHSTVVAHSLAEANKVLKKGAPDLVIIDCDPAYRGLTEFLEKMRELYPASRALVIAPGVSPELAAERRSFGALQFVEKPFDVIDFGAAVQALLGPWKEPDSAHSRGTLRSLNLADIILLQCAGGGTVTIEAKANSRKTGQVHVRKGQLSHAETGSQVGNEALEEMLTWPEVRMREADKPASRRRTIAAPWQTAFLEACRQAQAQQPAPIAPRKEIAPVKRQPKTGKKIVVIDDTEMLLIFVEDILATAEPDLQITTALNGTSGIKAIERTNPDLVLLDYSLPDINGDEVCRRLLENEQTARIPILMMSGHVAEMSQAAATYTNVVATIEKPFLSEALIGLVQQTLSAGPRMGPTRPAGTPKQGEAAAATPRIPAVALFDHQKVRATPEVTPPPPQEMVRSIGIPALSTAVAPLGKAAKAPVPSKPSDVTPPVQVGSPTTVRVEPPESPPSPARVTPPRPTVAKAADVAAPTEKKAEPVLPLAPELRTPTVPTISLPVASAEPNDVVLGLFLEVVSMQLTESLRMGAIRAKPASRTVSLHVSSPALRASFPANGFDLGPVEIDRNGRIVTLRLIPTLQPFTPQQTRNALQISGVAVVPANAHERVELMPAVAAPMKVQLLVHLELSGVELSNTFQVAQLVLKSTTKMVRVTFSSQSLGPDGTGATCEAAGVKLDASARITELLLHPVV
jgi:DNA-binding response OmpR family regulator